MTDETLLTLLKAELQGSMEGGSLLKRIFCSVAKVWPTLSQTDGLYVAHQMPLSMGFPKQEYWRGFPSPGGLSDPGIKPSSPALTGRLFISEPRGKT